MSLLKELVDEIKEEASKKEKPSKTYEDFAKFLGATPTKVLSQSVSVSVSNVSTFLTDSLMSIYTDKQKTQREKDMEKLETYKSPQQVDEAIQRLIEHYFEDEFKDWQMEDYPEDHIVHVLNILKTLYEQGGPDKVF